VQTCPSCGQENPEGFRLCGMCGASLAEEAAPAREERKVVTVVFCDLVGFTARAERLDPEDVRAVLRPYHDRVRSELERHGGTVEKFIGDAVMALFGAPTAHEDDPERAVRAALAIREFAVEEGLELRIGITTGEALVSLGASASEGEGMASGDVVNTAARLQSSAPVNGIIVDETTFRATRSAVEFDEAPSVEAKGKAEPISVWEASAAHSRFGVDVTHHARTALVGREREVAALRDAFERARHERMPQLVTLIAVPGMGKSRLVHELQRVVDADPELISWRQGRCLAYGDGVAFWALAETVKAHAGILEQDSEDDAAAKLRSAVADVLEDERDAHWVESHLRPLVGLETETGLGGNRRGEAFAAWRRFLEAMAEQRPLVLVFEDLHWADDGLLDFVDELVDWVSGVPILVVCSARPELLERRPGWGGGKINASTIGLSPLSSEQTAALISQVLDRSVLPVAIQQTLLERSEGNPLYAEQFAQLYLERGSADDLPLPETLQGIVAARLDGLSVEEKAVLQDASVVGKIFWTGALRRDESETTPLLHSLERKGFLTRQRRSSVESEGEWAFAHMLLRDVAYGQIPRTDRAHKHGQTAEWIESLGRSEDHAELVAFHWSSALELARTAGQDSAAFETPTRIALREAGDRAFALSMFLLAVDHYQAALALWPDDDERPLLLYRRAHALFLKADERREEALEAARIALLAAGDEEHSAETEILLARTLWEQGQRSAADSYLERAEGLASGGSPSEAKARVLSMTARLRALRGEDDSARRIADEALAMADALSLDELRSHSLGTIGLVKNRAGDPTAIRDLERSLELALEANSPLASQAANNLGVVSWNNGNVERWRELIPESHRLAQRVGDVQGTRWAQTGLFLEDFMSGRWEQALASADEFIAMCEAGKPHYMESSARETRAEIRIALGDLRGALEDADRSLLFAREAKDPQNLVPSLKGAARIYASLGRLDEARRLADELLPLANEHASENLYYHHPLWPVAKLGIVTEVRELYERARPTPWRDAELALLRGEFETAAQIYVAVGYPAIEAEVRLVAAEELVESGRRDEGEEQAARALDFYRSVGATLYIDRCEALLREAEAV
jgi:class 3 adenylate cyclase/tetratricopeptide (TPR) repeat protein